MTIVAGFPGKGVREDDGTEHPDLAYVVLCADSQESEEVMTSSVRKIATIDKGACKCLVAGAGGGDFVDLAIQEMAKGLTGSFTLDGVRTQLERIVTDIHLDRIRRLNQRELEFELLCAVWVQGEGVELVKVGPGFSLILDSPRTIGSGTYLARYLIATYHVPGLWLYHCTRLAVYLLSQAKRHVLYCGGASQVVWMDGNGRIQELWPGSIAQHEKSNEAVMDAGSKALLFMVDPMGWGFDLSKVDHAVDEIARNIKDNIKRYYPELAQVSSNDDADRGTLAPPEAPTSSPAPQSSRPKKNE